MQSKIRNRTTIIAGLALAVALGMALALFLFRQDPLPAEPPSVEQAIANLEDTATAAALADNGEDETGLIDPPAPIASTPRLGESETNLMRQAVVDQAPFPHDVLMDDYKRTLWEEVRADPPEFRRPGDPDLDGDMAYRLYMYFGNCSVTARAPEHVEMRLQRIAHRAENATGRMLEGLEENANELIEFYEFCSLIPPDVDPRLEAVTWMGEAVRLGHEIAQAQFYEKAMGFLLRTDRWTGAPPLVMLHPGIIEEFKATARFALNRAMTNGHPEAFLAMSRAVNDGVLYPKDPVLAYAYLRAAETVAGQNQRILSMLGQYKSRSGLARKLDASQLAEAENIAQQLRNGEYGRSGIG